MFHKLSLLTIVACTLAISVAQYHQPQYQRAQYQQQPQYQQAQYQQARYQQQPQQYQQQGPVPAQFPAGVDAHSCPDYPDCSNPLLTVQAVAKASDPRYLTQNTPVAPPEAESEYSPDVQQKLDRGEYIGDGDYHGEGLDEALAPEAAIRNGHYSSQSASPQYSDQSVQYPAQQAASQYSARPSTVQYSAQQAASQYSPRPGAVQYSAQQAASQYSPKPGAVQYSAQQAASQYSAQPLAVQYSAPQGAAVQYPAQRAASQYATAQSAQYPAQQAASQYSSPQYITAPQGLTARQYYQSRPAAQYTQASLVSPQYAHQPAPVHEARAYRPVANAIGAGSEPVPVLARVPAGVDPSACPNYPFCHS